MKNFCNLIFIVILVLVSICLGAPTKPQISEVFETSVKISLQRTINGSGLWAGDQPAGKGYEHFYFQDNHEVDDVVKVERYDLHETFTIDGADPTHCDILKTTIAMPSYWDWIMNATYVGTNKFNGINVDYWNYAHDVFNQTIGVNAATVNVPIEYAVEFSTFHTHFIFVSWNTTNVNQTLFDIPSICHPSVMK